MRKDHIYSQMCVHTDRPMASTQPQLCTLSLNVANKNTLAFRTLQCHIVH